MLQPVVVVMGYCMTRAFGILIIFAGLAFFYGRAMPPFEAADEAPHFLYVHSLLEDGELPLILSREEIAAQTDPTRTWSIETHQPPLYYAISAALISMTQRDDIVDYLRPNEAIFTMNINDNNPNIWLHLPGKPAGDTHIALYILRGFSVMLGMVTIWCVYLTARLLFEDEWLAFISMMFVAFIPTFISISASVNNDNLVTALYALGVYWSLRMWHQRRIQWRDVAVLSLILPAIALTKFTGASLYLVVYGALWWGVRKGYYPRQSALRLVIITLIASAVLAGWWYVRNWDLYGDPLALSATQAIWGRDYEIAATSGDPLAELLRIARSFWMMVGHLHEPVYGANWVFIYAAIITVMGIGGLIKSKLRDAAVLLMLVCALVAGMLLFGTRSVDISYGRLLFPALVAFVPLMVLGWSRLVTRWGAGFILLPLMLAAVLAPSMMIARAYEPLALYDSLPDDVPFIGAETGDLRLVAYEMHDETIKPGQTMTVDLYLRGNHPDNPMLMLTAVDAITHERLGFTGVFPGMAATDTLNPDQLYRARVRIKLDEVGDIVLSPRRVRLHVEWFSPSLFEDLPIVDGAGNPVETLFLDGAVLLDGRYEVPDTRYNADVVFGDAIQLTGYTVPNDAITPGETLEIALNWKTSGALADDWTLTVQLIEDRLLIDQDDGGIPGYPSSVWQDGTEFQVIRHVTIPADMDAESSYRLIVSWYRVTESGFIRLSAVGRPEWVQDNLFYIPQVLNGGE